MKKIKLKSKIVKKPKVTADKPKEKKQLWKTILSIILLAGIGVVSLCLVFLLYIVITSPDFEQQKLYQQEPSILYDVNGKEFARVGYEDSNVLSYDELPEVMIDAVVATEDSRFFQHNGLDLLRFIKASILQVIGKNYAGGASTLSMQVVKNTYTKGKNKETTAESFIRKFKDIYIAVFKLEKKYTKEEIIEFYLNSQWFASTTNKNVSEGIVGIERASEHYFGKSAKDINLAEASLLAGMFQNPVRYNPYKNPEGCRNRQRIVLTLLVNHGYITEEQKEAVLKIPVSSLLIEKQTVKNTNSPNQAFIDYVLKEVEEKLDFNAFDTPLKIYTTFNPDVQKSVSKVENGDVYKFLTDKDQIGIAVTSTEDGSLAAMSGGRNYWAKGTNRARDLNRQPGSTAKPIFDYAMYIENISQSTYAMFLDEKTYYTGGKKEISNYDGRHRGLITMRYALEDSRNVPAFKAFKAVSNIDQKIIEDFVHSLGIDYGETLNEAASIGGFNGVSPIELSAAYGTFARGGYYIEPYSYTKVVNTENNKEYINSYSKKQVMEESTAYMISNILIKAYKGSAPSGTSVAGKTGTTNLDKDTKTKYGLPSGALLDAWIVSYSPSYSIALWYGYDELYKDAAEKGYYLKSTTGGTGRRKMMNSLAKEIHEKNQEFKVPKTITKANVELETFPAQLCSEFTPSSMCVEEYFVKGAEPTDVSTRFSKLENPTNGTYTFNGSTITLKWEPISTPDAINPTTLQSHFNKYYKDLSETNQSEKYYNNRLTYNSQNIGTLGYQIYLVNDTGVETYLGYTNSTSFNYNAPSAGNYTFVVKSAYSIFKNNMSNGLKILAQSNIDSNVDDLVNDNPPAPTIPDTPTTPSN